jgi:hypothetical protein
VVLDLFLVVFDLLPDPVGRVIKGLDNVHILVGRDKLVLVFGQSDDFHRKTSVVIAVEIDCHCNRGESIKKVE